MDVVDVLVFIISHLVAADVFGAAEERNKDMSSDDRFNQPSHSDQTVNRSEVVNLRWTS